MSVDTHDLQEPIEQPSQQKYTAYFVIGLLTLIVLFSLSMWWLDYQSVMHHEQQFNEQQALQTFLTKQALEDHIAWLSTEASILGAHSLPKFAQGKRDIGSMRDLFLTEQIAYPEVLAYIYLDRPDYVLHAQISDTPAGAEAERVSSEWASTYWSELASLERSPLVPPFHITAEYQIFGMLFPVQVEGELHGVLVLAVDLKPLVERYVVPMRSGQYGAGFLLDGQGTIVYDHETEIIGRNVFDGMHANYPDLMRFDNRLVSEPTGQDEYHFTVQRGGQVSRKLAAWNTVMLGDQSLIVVLSAPDIEFDKALADLRLQRILFGVVLALTLLGLSAIFFRFRQNLLEETARELRNRVQERTAELASSETRYRLLVENAPLGVLSFDRDGNILAVNSALLEVLGSPSADATKQINLFSFPLLVKAGWSEAFRQCLDRGEKVVIQRPYSSKWGKTTELRSHFSPARNSAGEVIGGQVLVEDFTILKTAQDALEAEKERLRLVVQNMPVMMTAFDDGGNIIVWNRECELVTGYSADEIVGNPKALELLYPTEESRHRIFELWQERGSDYRNWEWEVTCKEGQVKTILWSNISGQFPIQGWSSWSIGFDITERREAKEKLAEERNLLRTLIDNLPDSHVYVKDTESRFVDTNATHLQFLGVQTIEDIKGRTDFDFYPPELANQFFADEQEVIRSGQPLFDREEPNVDKNGNRKWVLTTKVPLRDNQGKITGLVGLSRDITKYKRLEEQLHQTQRLEAIGTLAGGIAHDFNNMLTAIMGYTGLTLEMLPDDSPVRSDIHGIQKTAERAAHLTRQLLAFARRQIVELKVIDLNELILNIDKMLRRLIGENIELVTLPDPIPCRIKADPHQIEQVLVNLVVNARDAMPNGGKLTVTTARVTLSLNDIQQMPELDPGRYVRLTVADTGVGMTEEVKAHLFEPFFTTKEVGQGTGLGLATCFGIIKQSGGHILAESEFEQGTSFQIYLSQVEYKTNLQFNHLQENMLPEGTETILLVEDETAVRELAARVLSEHGYTVLEAANGEEALRLIQENEKTEFHLLLADVVMPQLGGPELADRLMVTQPDLKVLFISGYTNSTTLSGNSGETRSSFLSKPFPPEVLVRKVREVLDT